MANFLENQYPWPTDPTSEVGTETGGNTRLLFAEQDNYRTQKGADGTVQANASGTATRTEHAVGGAWKGGSVAAPTTPAPTSGDIYYHLGATGDGVLGYYYYDGSDWNRIESSVDGFDIVRAGTTNFYVVFEDGDDHDHTWGSTEDLVAALDSYADSASLDFTTNTYMFFGSFFDSFAELTGYTPGASTDQAASGVNDIFYVIPRVVSADIAETTENIPIEFLKGSLSANKAQAGAQTYGNGFSIAASEEGLHLFLRTLCNARSNDINVVTRNANDSNTTAGRRDGLSGTVTVVTGTAVDVVSDTSVDFDTEIEDDVVVRLLVKPTSLGSDGIAEIQIDGYDHAGEELREIMILTQNDQVGGGKLTDFYFAKPPDGGNMTSLKVLTAGASNSMVEIEYIDNWTEVTFNQQDSVLLPGWTVEVRKGTIPFTYTGVSPNEASIALSRDTALQLDITTIAFDSKPYTDMAGNRVNLEDGTGSEGIDIVGAEAKGELDFVDASETLFTGWQAFLDVTEPGTARPVRVPLTDATFSINHQLDQAQLIVGDRRPGPPFRTTLRDVMLDGTILFTRERDWVRLFRNNTDFKNPIVVLRNAPAGGFPYELHIELGLGQLMSSPDPQVSDLGLITQAFNMKFRETMSGRSDDFRFKIITDKWVFTTHGDTVGGLRVDGVYA